MRMRLPISLLVAGALGACAHSQVQDLGDGRHLITALSPSGGYYGSHEEALEEANDFCAKTRQTAAIDHFEDLPGAGPAGQHTSTMVFTCTAPAVLHF
jgi:hypothetical protein